MDPGGSIILPQAPQVAPKAVFDAAALLPPPRPRIVLVICEAPVWFQFMSARKSHWTGLDFDDYKSSVRNFLTYNVGLMPHQTNIMSVMFERLVGLQPLLLAFMHKLSSQIDQAKPGPTGPVYVLRVPATLATTVRTLCKAAWPKAAVSLAPCPTAGDAVKAAEALEATALPFSSALFPDA